MKDDRTGAGGPGISLIRRREIEARVAMPLIDALMQVAGKERALEKLREAISSLACERGAQLAAELGGDSLEHLARGIISWTEDDSLEVSIIEKSERAFAFHVSRCQYAELYRELGIPPEVGYELSCHRDFVMLEGFNRRISLSRRQTIMEGAPFCDFRYSLE